MFLEYKLKFVVTKEDGENIYFNILFEKVKPKKIKNVRLDDWHVIPQFIKSLHINKNGLLDIWGISITISNLSQPLI